MSRAKIENDNDVCLQTSLPDSIFIGRKPATEKMRSNFEVRTANVSGGKPATEKMRSNFEVRTANESSTLCRQNQKRKE